MLEKPIKVLHLNFSDNFGGAARATLRINHACNLIGLDSKILVIENLRNDNVSFSVIFPIKKYFLIVIRKISRIIIKLANSKDNHDESLSIFGSGLVHYINNSKYDVVNLHWINGEMLSIGDIRKITKPIVWTLHDMWPFCGIEHYTENKYYISGEGIKSFSLNNFVFKLKKQKWSNVNINIVGPSNWITKCAKSSILFKKQNCLTIPNPVDGDIFFPMEMKFCRQYFGFSNDVCIILFGAVSGTDQFRKGFDLLLSALSNLNLSGIDVEVAVFGGKADEPIDCPFKIHNVGKIDNDKVLSYLYNSSDVFVLPSRQDNLPNTLVEASSCGVPSVSFNVGGCSDIIEQYVTGYLATPNDTIDLAHGISYILQNRTQFSRELISKKSIEKYSFEKVGSNYYNLYKNILS